jgi:riboflavin synthase alpha subunit
VSLTIGEVQDNSFCIYIVPHTGQVTTLASLQVGERVNLEVDILARYVRSCVLGAPVEGDARLLKVLEEHGYTAGKAS